MLTQAAGRGMRAPMSSKCGNMPSTINGTTLSALEPRDSLHLCCARAPPSLPTDWDGRCSGLSASHALQCKGGGLAPTRHDEIEDELTDIASHAPTPSAVHAEPAIDPSPQLTHVTPLTKAQQQMSKRPTATVGVCSPEGFGGETLTALWVPTPPTPMPSLPSAEAQRV